MDDRGHTGKLHIAIIGAGFSGLSVAHYLRKYTNLQSFVIYEKSARTNGGAGTWKDNTYPGCACDVPIHLYQLSWAKRSNWTEYLPLQPEIQKYLDETAQEHGIYRHIQFGTELIEARWIEAESMWALKLRNLDAEDPEDAVYTVKHHVVVMATGPLSQPRMPEGIDTNVFQGRQFHSQHWRHDITLENKRVAVVGNGCSATQFLPIIARRCKSLTQYVSSPQWYIPRDNPLYTDTQKALFRWVPLWEEIYRLYMAYSWESEAYKLKGGEGPAKVRAQLEGLLVGYMKATAPERYHEQLTPRYPLGCKRLVFDSNYFSSLHADNVDLLFTRVKDMHEQGIVGADGSKKDYDVIIWATGFLATMPFTDTKVYGRSGQELHERWASEGGPSAYAGLAVPDCPNFYMTTGPNTLSGHYSVTTIIEIQAQWISQVLKMQLDNDVKSFEITQTAHNDYNKWIRELMKGRVWTSSLCNSWFKTKDGFIPTNFPGTTSLYWTKVYYPNMSHMRQVGGVKQVKGTTITREIRRTSLIIMATVATLFLLRAKQSTLQHYARLARGLVSDGIRNSLLRARDTLSILSGK